jgi:hypothetical protein
MRRARILTTVLVTLATLGLCLPPTAFAGETPPKAVAVDVALMDGGVLVGQVVDSQGSGIENAPVLLRHEGKSLATPRTGSQGYFALKDLRPGVYQLASAKSEGAYRLWAPGTAPPTAQKGALLVANDGVARGQLGQGGLKVLLANPWVAAAIVATAVAVPVAIHNSNRHDSHSP